MKLNIIRTVLGLSFLSMLLSFQNCSNAKFTSDADTNLLNAVTGDNSGIDDGRGDDANCHPATTTSNKIVKVLFVVDASGSNKGEGGEDPTDPQKTWRSTTIGNFIDAYKSRSNFYYGMITFQGDSAKPQIKVNNKGVFSNDSSVVEAGKTNFMNNADGGSTPYKAALSLAKSIIQADLSANAAQQASYVMVMVSDGMAKDYSSPDQVIPDAQAIRNMAPGQISLNTVYYYPSAFDESQTKYLRNIASTGGGQFLTANSQQTLKIDDVIQVPGNSCH